MAAHNRFLTCAAILLSACGDRLPKRVAAPMIVFHTDASKADYGAVDVVNVDPSRIKAGSALQSVFKVRANDSTGIEMLGTYAAHFDTLRFTPRFPPAPGTTYYAEFDGRARGTWKLDGPSGKPTTVVETVYPSGDVVPMNLLRMYIQFSAPMSVGDGAELHVRLLDEKGDPVNKPFLIAAGEQELWDREHKRLTIFFDPGRIKRDLVPHKQLGLPLVEGHSYTLVIDTAWRDATGLPLAKTFTRTFRVGPMDRTLVRADSWHVSAPSAGSHSPLVVDFGESLDRALAQRMISVRIHDTPVAGSVTLSRSETRWTFVASQPWPAGTYDIVVDTELEDLAGNNLHRLFDVMPGDTASRGVSGTSAHRAFVVR
ncbi:MAG TPA: Ig-like domain-containing protein [Gemmatimonadaceae bacterium]|nr:Ig-like domain-containing protein [Gemmatimonadaceae bacterium]